MSGKQASGSNNKSNSTNNSSNIAVNSNSSNSGSISGSILAELRQLPESRAVYRLEGNTFIMGNRGEIVSQIARDV